MTRASLSRRTFLGGAAAAPFVLSGLGTQAHAAGLTVRALDNDMTVGKDLGKFDAEELLQLSHAHFRICHAFPALASASLLH